MIVSDVTVQAISDSQVPFHLAAVINSVYMMKLKQEHISKCSVVRDEKQCHLIKPRVLFDILSLQNMLVHNV